MNHYPSKKNLTRLFAALHAALRRAIAVGHAESHGHVHISANSDHDATGHHHHQEKATHDREPGINSLGESTQTAAPKNSPEPHHHPTPDHDDHLTDETARHHDGDPLWQRPATTETVSK